MDVNNSFFRFLRALFNFVFDIMTAFLAGFGQVASNHPRVTFGIGSIAAIAIGCLVSPTFAEVIAWIGAALLIFFAIGAGNRAQRRANKKKT